MTLGVWRRDTDVSIILLIISIKNEKNIKLK